MHEFYLWRMSGSRALCDPGRLPGGMRIVIADFGFRLPARQVGRSDFGFSRTSEPGRDIGCRISDCGE
jgi:hypothetical protein